MLRLLLPVMVAGTLTAAGAAAGFASDSTRVSAAALQLEPALLVMGIWSVALAGWARRPRVAMGIAAGLVGATLAARVPYPAQIPEGVPPDWVSAVHQCAAAIDRPTSPVRILQWTLHGDEPLEAVLAAVVTARPSVVVLHRVKDLTLVEELRAMLASEARVRKDADGATAILATGGFHPCGETDGWTDGEMYGLSVHFVGVPPATVFPLVVTSFPGPFDHWQEGAEARQRAVDVLSGLDAASTVVVADTRSPRSARSLGTDFVGMGLTSVPLPPNWPARAGTVPLLTLHPFSRIWLGPIWRARATRVAATVGQFAPVLVQLDGERAGAG